jgi:TolB-like protein/DNA-binding winged helix-turn-helix (wHTH) protein/Flp pilus assembly protein TadD
MTTRQGPGETATTPERYCFDGVVVDATAHTLARDDQPVAVEPKAFAVLLVLLRRAGELVRHDDLLDIVWGHRHVTPGVLTRAIAQLRHALDDHSQHPRYIQTQHGLGYRFIGTLVAEPAMADGALPDDAQPAAAAIALESPSSVSADAEAEGDTRRIAGDLPSRRDNSLAAPSIDIAQRGVTPARSSGRPWLVAALLLAMGIAVWLWQRPVPVSSMRSADASIAVLPFNSLSSNRDDTYFAEGLSVEMHDALAGVPGLKVAACRTGSACGNRATDAKTLGKTLGVATVLDADVRREGQRVRISARLSDTQTGFTLWSGSYDRELTDVFALQREIAHEVVISLGGALPDDGEGLRKRLTPTRNVAAFDAYLKGLQQLLRRDSSGNEDSAIGFFREALASDSGFARAQAGICRAELKRFEGPHNAEAFDNARMACLRAGKMDPTLGEVALALGDLYRVRGDLDKAVGYYRQIEQDPALRSLALVGLAKVHSAQGREDLALSHFQRALEARPGDATIYSAMAYRQYVGGKVHDAIASYRKAVELQPDDANLWSNYGGLQLVAGNNATATQALERSLEIEPSDAVLSNLGTIRYQAGEYAAAADLYRRATALNPGDFVIWGNLGDALVADPATATQARDAFREAASRAQRYVEIKPDDAKALAALGWYRANLEETVQAKELVRRSEALASEPAEVALFNAQTFALFGDVEQARRRVAAARAAGMAENRIVTNAVLRRANVTSKNKG